MEDRENQFTNNAPKTQEPSPTRSSVPISDVVDKALDSLKNAVPNAPSVNVPKRVDIPKEDKIETANKKANEAVLDAHLKVTNIYSKHEEKRLELQQPLLEQIVKLTKVQLWFFNLVIVGVICIVLYISTKNSTLDLLSNLLDFLKYYVGAVLVELISMVFFVTKSTFSSNHSKMMENVLKMDSKKSASDN